jgi:hypothetical protein
MAHFTAYQHVMAFLCSEESVFSAAQSLHKQCALMCFKLRLGRKQKSL